jgi:hypothetical protein
MAGYESVSKAEERFQRELRRRALRSNLYAAPRNCYCAAAANSITLLMQRADDPPSLCRLPKERRLNPAGLTSLQALFEESP